MMILCVKELYLYRLLLRERSLFQGIYLTTLFSAEKVEWLKGTWTPCGTK
jgi:hypothetical protein